MSLAALVIVLMLGIEMFRPFREMSQLFHQGMVGLSASQGIFHLLDGNPVVEGEADITVPEAVASTGEIRPDGRVTLTLELEPGRYVLLSNLPAQYESGMFRPITVQ